MASGRGIGETARLLAQLDLRDNMSRGIGTVLGSLGRLEGGLGRMSRGAGQVSSGLDRLGTRAALVAAGGLAAVVKTSASFEQAFAGIEKTVDATAPQFAALNEQFRDMARTVPVSFEELAGIGAAGGALGIARQDLLDFTDVVSRLAVSTNLSSDQAATALGQLGNVLHLSGGEFREFADSLVNLGNKGASTEAQIVDIAARFGAAGNAAGLSKEEILALSSAVASMGVQTEAAGSSLSRIFNSVATNIGTSSDKAVAFADTLGLSAKEFRRAWEEDALGTFQDFLKELSKLDQFEQASVLKSIGITNTRDISAVRLMGQNVKFVADQLKVAQDANGALGRESQKFFDTATGQWKVLVNNIRDAGVTIGNEVLPIFKDLVQEFSAFLNRPETRRGLREFGEDLAGFLRKAVQAVKEIDFSSVLDQMKTAASFAKVAFDAFNALPAGLKGVIVGGIVLNKATGGALGQITAGLTNIIGGAFDALAPKLGPLGALAGRGSSPLNPLFVTQVGGGGPGDLLSKLPLVAGGGALAVGLTAATIAAIGVAFVSSQLQPRDPFAEPGAHITPGRGFGDPSQHFVPGSANDPRHTPLGQFNALNRGGVPAGGVPVRVNNAGDLVPPALFERMGDEIRVSRKAQLAALKAGDVHEARLLEGNIDAIHALRGSVNRAANTIVPHLGRTNRALSVANRNLDDGNARQRQMDHHIEEARRTIGTGFRATDDGIRQTAATTHRHLSGIEAQERATAGNTGKIAKQGPPTVNVTVPVSTIVSINDIIRAQSTYSTALSLGSQTRSGFKP